MTIRRRTSEGDTSPSPTSPDAPSKPTTSPAVGIQPRSPLAERLGPSRTPEEAEQRYVAARDAWTAAMRAANSGRAADLATLAVAQEAFEAASTDVERWRRGGRVAVPVTPEAERRPMDAIVGQELAWRKVRAQDDGKRPGLLGRVSRRIRGR